MSAALAPGANRSLLVRSELQLDRWIRPCYTKPDEHIAASANELGEVWLSGLVEDPRLVAEAIRLIREVPGVRHVFNHGTVMYAGQPIHLSH